MEWIRYRFGLSLAALWAMAGVCTVCAAQSTPTLEFPGYWVQLDLTFPVYRKVELTGDFQLRMRTADIGYQRGVIRPGIQYRPVKNLTFGAGYSYLTERPSDSPPVLFFEQNGWVRGQIEHHSRHLDLAFRVWVEKRWLGSKRLSASKATGGRPGELEYGPPTWRSRYMGSVGFRPIGNPRSVFHAFSLMIRNERFYAHDGPAFRYAHNWSFVGLHIDSSPSSTFELGYLREQNVANGPFFGELNNIVVGRILLVNPFGWKSATDHEVQPIGLL